MLRFDKAFLIYEKEHTRKLTKFIYLLLIPTILANYNIYKTEHNKSYEGNTEPLTSVFMIIKTDERIFNFFPGYYSWQFGLKPEFIPLQDFFRAQGIRLDPLSVTLYYRKDLKFNEQFCVTSADSEKAKKKDADFEKKLTAHYTTVEKAFYSLGSLVWDISQLQNIIDLVVQPPLALFEIARVDRAVLSKIMKGMHNKKYSQEKGLDLSIFNTLGLKDKIKYIKFLSKQTPIFFCTLPSEWVAKNEHLVKKAERSDSQGESPNDKTENEKGKNHDAEDSGSKDGSNPTKKDTKNSKSKEIPKKSKPKKISDDSDENESSSEIFDKNTNYESNLLKNNSETRPLANKLVYLSIFFLISVLSF